jgi:hypothetical protein
MRVHRLDVGRARHVHPSRDGCRRRALRNRLLGRGEIDVGGAHLRALLREEDRRVAAHTAAGARDHADLAVEPAAHASVETNTFFTSE